MWRMRKGLCYRCCQKWRRALDLRKQHRSGSGGITCAITTDVYVWGGSNLIYEVAFSDNVYWILRVGLESKDPEMSFALKADHWDALLEQEVAVMRLVKEKTTIPVPEVYDYGGCSDMFGRPFILMSALPGVVPSHLGLDISSWPREDKDLFLANPAKENLVKKLFVQLADIADQLSRVTSPTLGTLISHKQEDGSFLYNMASTPFDDPELRFYPDFYQFLNARFLDMINKIDKIPDPQTRSRRRFITALYRATVLSLLNIQDAFGPFPLQHGDLTGVNLLLDDDANITGVIDWQNAQFVPVNKFAFIAWYTQDITFDPKEVPNTNNSLFIDALREIEAKDGYISPFPSGRLLSDLHGSHLARVIIYNEPSFELLGMMMGTTEEEAEERVDEWMKDWEKSPWPITKALSALVVGKDERSDDEGSETEEVIVDEANVESAEEERSTLDETAV